MCSGTRQDIPVWQRGEGTPQPLVNVESWVYASSDSADFDSGELLDFQPGLHCPLNPRVYGRPKFRQRWNLTGLGSISKKLLIWLNERWDELSLLSSVPPCPWSSRTPETLWGPAGRDPAVFHWFRRISSVDCSFDYSLTAVICSDALWHAFVC